MATLTAVIREAIRRGGTEVGYVVPVSSLTSSSLTSAALADGSPSSKHEGKYVTRRNAASTSDRKRRIASFLGTTGALSTQGASYSDTTATDEYAEITDLDPYLFEWAAQVTLSRLRHFDSTEFPTGSDVRYWLDDLTWITSLADLTGYKVTYRNSPQLTRNRYMEKWHCVSPDTASTTALPDWFAIAGSSGTCARSTTGVVRGKYSAAVLRSGTNVTFSQSVPTYLVTELRGKAVGGFMRVRAGSASQVRLQVYDGVDTTSSSFHSGGSQPEDLQVSHTVNAAATEVTVRASVEVNGTVYIDELYAHLDSMNEALSRDDYGEEPVNPQFSAGEGTLNLILRSRGLGGQYIVYTKRPYPTFDETRLMSGAADSDDIDAPLQAWSIGVLARAYEQASATVDGPRKAFYAVEAGKWESRVAVEAQRNLYRERSAEGKSAARLLFTPKPSRFGGRR